MRLIKVINAGSPAALISVYMPISSMPLLTRVYGRLSFKTIEVPHSPCCTFLIDSILNKMTGPYNVCVITECLLLSLGHDESDATM